MAKSKCPAVSINIGGNQTTSQFLAKSSTVQLINDGIIAGSGTIETGVFNNRYYGQVRVGAGELLVIDSASDFISTTDALPLTNYGVMQVFGTLDAFADLEFDRAPSTTLHAVQPFQNLRVDRPTGRRIRAISTAG